MRSLRKLGPGILAGVLVLLLTAGTCSTGNDSSEEQRRQSVETRAETFARAERVAPVPHTDNFPLRKALVKMTARQDLEHHPWYVYILGDNGNIIGYYVGQTVPVNACDFLSSTEDVRYDSDGGNIVLSAPSLDGIYYGGSGAASGCDAWFFFDSATDALIQIRGVKFFTSDQPLRVDAEPIEVATRP